MAVEYSLSDLALEDVLVLQKHYLGMASAISSELVARSRAGQQPRSEEPGRPWRQASPLDAVLDPAVPGIRDAAMEIVKKVSDRGGVGDPILERTRDGKRPRYFRLTSGSETVAYVWVRRDHLRIDLPVPAERLDGIGGEIRAREVQAKNPWKTSLYVRGSRGIDPAVEAIKFATSRLEGRARR